ADADVFLAVADEDARVLHDGRAVNHIVAELVLPDLLAGADLQPQHRAVGRAGDELADAVDVGDDRRGVIRDGAFRRAAPGGPPHHRAVLLVEGGEAVGAARLVAPAAVNHAENEQVAIDDRAGKPAAVATAAAELLDERTLPEDFAVGREAGQ